MIRTKKNLSRLRFAPKASSWRGVFVVLVLLVLPLFLLTRVGSRDAYAATSDNLNFQARLETAAGAIAPDGYYNLEFKIYSVSTGGTALWSESYTGGAKLRVVNGYVTVNLGSSTAFPSTMPWDQQLYLTMNVGGTGAPSWDGEMSPRLKLTAVPYAFNAKTASQLVTTSGANTASLSIQAPTSGDQTFVLQDQGAAGTYNLLTDGNAGTLLAGTFIQNQNASAQTANYWLTGSARADTSVLTPLLDTATAVALNIGTTNATSINLNQSTTIAANKNITFASGTGSFDQSASSGTFKTGTGAVSLNGDTTVAAGKSLTVTGGNTASRPASPTEGMIYYDTTTKQLLTYANGKWQSDRTTSTKIVAASNSSQAAKDAADYVATGTSDQTTINSALTAAAGGKVYLMEGTYTINAAISIPNNTTLAGAGNGTLITIPNGLDPTSSSIVNSDQTTGTGVVIRDLKVDGNKTNQTANSGSGIEINGVGSSTLPGATVTSVTATNWRGAGLEIDNSARVNVNDSTLMGNSIIGLSLYNSNNISVIGNQVHNNIYGISVSNTTNSTISSNTTKDNDTNIVLDTASNISITGNSVVGGILGIYVAPGSSSNVVSSNSVADSGMATENNGIYIDADKTVVIGNVVSDSSCTTTCDAIYVAGASNYLSNNTLHTGAVNNSGTNTIYGGQLNASGNYLIQPAGTIELLKNTNVTGNLAVTGTISGGSSITLGVASTTNGTIILKNSTNANTVTISSDAQTHGSYTLSIPDLTGNATICTSLDNCPIGGSSNYYIQNQNSTNQTADFRISGTGRINTALVTPVIRPITDSTTALKIQNAAGSADIATFDTTNGTVTLQPIDTNGGTLSTNLAFVIKNASGTPNIEIRASDYTSNTFIGRYSGQANTTGYSNTALGTGALMSNTDGYSNSAFGRDSLSANTTGYNNQGIGFASLSSNNIGNNNTALGSYAISANTSGSGNVGLGWNSLSSNGTGSYNIALGYSSGYYDSGNHFSTLSNLQRSTAIGAYAQVQASDSIILGSVDNATKVGIGITVPSNTLSVSPLDYQTGTVTRTNGSTTLAGTGTTWTSAMVGDIIVFADGTTNTVASFTDATHVTMGTTFTGTTDASPVYYRFHKPGLNVTSTGNVGIGTTSPNSSYALDVNGTINATNILLGGTALTSAFIQNQNASAQTANYWLTGSARADTSVLTPLLDTATAVALNIGTTNATSINLNQSTTIAANKNITFASGTGSFDQSASSGTFKTGTGAVSLNGDTTVAAGKSLTVTGGNTASRPASPTEGMIYYDTTTKQLLTYANGKWQSDRTTSTKIVAASNSSQAAKDAADYVATGTSDQTTINSALTAAAGGKVYLMEGTYTITASVSIPNNTILAGAGDGTVITRPNSNNTDFKFVTNTDTSTGTGVVVRDLKINGNSANNTGGLNSYGIALNGVGSGSGASTLRGGLISNVSVYNFNISGFGVGIDITGTGTTIENSAVINTGRPLRAFGVTKLNVHNNLFRESYYGITQMDETVFTGNVVEDADQFGVTVGSNATVTGNVFKNVYYTAINVAGDSSTVTGNKIYRTTSSTNFKGFSITGDKNIISSNSFSCASNCTMLDISASADSTYLADNTSSTSSGSVTNSDSGTNTIYGGQLNTSGVFNIQNAGGVAIASSAGTATSSVTISTGNASAGASGNISLDTGTATTTAGTISIGTTNASGVTIGRSGVTTTIQGNTGVTLSATTGTTMVCRNGSGLLSSCDATYLAPSATNFIQNQNASAQTANYWLTGSARADTSVLTPLLDTATAVALNIGTTNATSINLNQSTTIAANKNITFASGTGSFDQSASSGTFKTGTGAVSLNGDTTVAAGKSLTVTGGNTASRPASPTEGMIYYDTTTKQLLTYANGKWQSDRTTSTKIVAASNSSQAAKDAADYVATGTSDQTTINSALTAAAGGKVYLMEGTYTINNYVGIPDYTTLAGAGSGTIITLPNSLNTSTDMVRLAAGANGRGVVVRDLTIDGNGAGQTSGLLTAINFGGGGSTTTPGSIISHVVVKNMLVSGWGGNGIQLNGSYNTIEFSTTINVPLPFNIFGGDYNTVSGNKFVTGAQSSRLNAGTNHVVTNNSFVSAEGIWIISSTNSVVSGNNIRGATTGVTAQGDDNVITSNEIHGTGAGMNGLSVSGDRNLVSSNRVICGANCTGLSISASADSTYLSDNTYSTTSGSVTNSDSGTNTIYGGQLNTSGVFNIQNAGGVAIASSAGTATSSVTISTGNASAGASGNISLDTGTATTTAGTISIGTTNASGVTIGRSGVTTTIQGNTGVTLSATTGTTMVCRNGSGLLSSCDATYLAPSATNFIQNQNASAQTSSNFWISGSGKAASLTATGNVYSPDFDTATAAALTIGVANASSVTIGKAGINTTLLSSNIIVGSATGNTTIYAAAQTTGNTAGNSITIKGSDGLGTGTGGIMTIKGGTGGATNANGGTLALSGGDAGGTGVKGLVTLDPTAFTTAAAQNFAANGSITQANVDSKSAVLVTASAAGYTVTLNDPTITTAGRILYVTNYGSYDFTLSVNGGGTGNTIAMKPATTATMIWNGADWTAAGASSSTDLQSAYNNTLTSAGGAELVLNAAGGAADGLTIRNNGTTAISGGLLEVQTSIGTNLFSVNSYGTELASNGGAETAGGSSTTFPSNTWVNQGASTVTRTITSGEYQTGQAGVKVVTAGSSQGVYNKLTGNPAASTTYTVSFTAASTTAGQFTTPIEVIYSPDGGTTNITCQGFGQQNGVVQTTSRSISNSTSYNWTKVTCTVTTTAASVTNPILIVRQTDATARTMYLDNLSFIRNDSTTRPASVQMGGGNTGGQVTLFTLDRSSTAPLVANGDDRYLGSMYYDTTLGNIQCYELDGWGACGSAPDNIVTLTPEYTGAVLNGTGVGTMTADFCGNGGGLSVNTGFCASGEARNYYRWTSPQPTPQTYSIYVTYKLPSTFKNFVSGTTSMTGLVDNTTNAGVSYSIFRKASGGGLTSCSASKNVVGSGSGTANTWTSAAPTTDPSSCTSFVAGDSVVFQITVNAQSNASAYAENLTFQFANK